MAARRPGGKIPAALVALVLVGLALAGCSVVRGAVSTITALDRAGFKASNVQPGDGTDAWEVTVEKKDAEDLDAAAAEAAGVVWHKLPLRIERLRVSCGNGFGGKGTFEADRAELERRFGARNPDLDRGIQDRDLRIVALVLIGLVVVGLVVLAGIVILVVVLVRRSRRRNRPPGPPGGGVPQAPPPQYRPPA
jgi:hypothetical protein